MSLYGNYLTEAYDLFDNSCAIIEQELSNFDNLMSEINEAVLLEKVNIKEKIKTAIKKLVEIISKIITAIRDHAMAYELPKKFAERFEEIFECGRRETQNAVDLLCNIKAEEEYIKACEDLETIKNKLEELDKVSVFDKIGSKKLVKIAVFKKYANEQNDLIKKAENAANKITEDQMPQGYTKLFSLVISILQYKLKTFNDVLSISKDHVGDIEEENEESK